MHDYVQHIYIIFGYLITDHRHLRPLHHLWLIPHANYSISGRLPDYAEVAHTTTAKPPVLHRLYTGLSCRMHDHI